MFQSYPAYYYRKPDSTECLYFGGYKYQYIRVRDTPNISQMKSYQWVIGLNPLKLI
jgi:hypothetical protein